MAPLRLFARFAYVPTMIVGLNGLAIALLAGGYSYAWIGVLFGLAVGLSLLMEQALPYEQAWNRPHDDQAKDLAHGVIYEINNITAILLLPLVTMLIPWRGIWPP